MCSLIQQIIPNDASSKGQNSYITGSSRETELCFYVLIHFEGTHFDKCKDWIVSICLLGFYFADEKEGNWPIPPPSKNLVVVVSLFGSNVGSGTLVIKHVK